MTNTVNELKAMLEKNNETHKVVSKEFSERYSTLTDAEFEQFNKEFDRISKERDQICDELKRIVNESKPNVLEKKTYYTKVKAGDKVLFLNEKEYTWEICEVTKVTSESYRDGSKRIAVMLNNGTYVLSRVSRQGYGGYISIIK